MDWRRLLRVLHRDVGYFLAPLVVVFAVSGVAVNHIDTWNPSYARSTTAVALGPLDASDLDLLERTVTEKTGAPRDEVRGRRLESPRRFTVFLDEGGAIVVDPATGVGTYEHVEPRAVLFEVNALHLNHLKGVWTWVSDAFAVLLAGLAISGVLLLPGRTGLAGRGKWFLAAGTAVPVAFVIVYYASR